MGGPLPTDRSRVELFAELEPYRQELGGDDHDALFCLFQKDLLGRFVWMNERSCRYFGRPLEAIVGRTDFDLLPPLHAQKYRDDDLRVMAEGKPFRTFESNRAADGSKRLVQVVKVTWHDESGGVAGVLGAFWDSLSRSDVECRLHESEERLRSIIEQMPVMLSAMDHRGLIGFWNLECERVTGYSAAEIVGKPEGLQLLYPDPNYLNAMIDTWRNGRGPERDWEWMLTCKDGSTRTISWTGLAGVIPISGWASWGVGLDVTEKKSAQAILDAIREVQNNYIAKATTAELSEQLLSHLLQVSQSDFGFIGEILYMPTGEPYLKTHAISNIAWNEETRAFYERNAPVGMEFHNLKTLFGAVITEGRPVIANEPSTDPRRGGLPDGHPPLKAFLGVPLYHDGRFLGMVGLGNRPGGYGERTIDVIAPLLATCSAIIASHRAERERQRQEGERRRLEAQLQYAQKLESLGVLAGGIAHDFNNLLVSILGHASLALEDLSPASRAWDSLQSIETAAVRAADLCKQMLAYSGKGRFVIRRINISELVEEMAQLLQISLSKKIVLRYNLVKDVPPIEADATQLRQIMMNLITNASESCGDKSGLITITTGRVTVDREYLATMLLDESLELGPYVFMEVSDTGCGMDEATRSKMFDPFFTTKATGRGLGMAAVLGIVRGHRGAMKCYSEPGRGTTFKVIFPATHGEADSIPELKPIQKVRAAGTILVVDDEEGVRTLAQHVLERQGFKILTAKDGREGVEIYRLFQDEIVVVLLDMTMPHLNGDEVFREMRKMRENVRVILSSGYNEQEATNRFVGKGLAGFIQKPYRPSDLLEMIHRILGAGPG